MEKESYQNVNLIVGAGITGLTAAYCLVRAGERCLLVESESEVGGLCRTYVIDDIPFDFGPHVFFADPDSDVKKFTMDLLKDEEVLYRPYRFAIHVNGKFWKFPISLTEVFRYPWKYKKEILKSFLKKNKPNPIDEHSLADFIMEKSGQAYYSDLLELLIDKKTLMPGWKLHRDWWLRTERNINNEVEPFIAPIKAGRLLERIFRKLFPWYNYPLKGYGRIPQILWERFHECGGETILNCGQISLACHGRSITHATVKGRTVPIKNVIWTGSINALNSLLNVNVPKLPYVDMIIACFTFNKKTSYKRPFIYTYHPQEDLIFNRIYYPANIYGNNLPSDQEGLCMELNVTDSIREMTEEAIIDSILQGVDKLGLYKKEALRGKRLFLLKNCLPVYGLDYKKRLKYVFSEVHRIHNLYAIGRMGGHFFCLSPSAINQGLKIANHLLNEPKSTIKLEKN